MNALAHVSMAIAISATWLATLAFVRMRTPLERLHCATYVNVVTLTFLTIAVFLINGVDAVAFKSALITVVTVLIGALGSHVVARAIFTRSGEKR